ncbi:aldehyde reductase ii [Colletotrichum kahawae]|uniref:Aldehyde reductase ii n=1 Tax=Colletotrichum kahawae TaxID=34407 RepID=A0AAE0DB02_COLKA|nr:aldehyde reductase ii [Colletotrichum kahawae]
MSSPQTVIPQGSWVLITGATGHIAAHTVKQFLQRGFKVRGSVRDLEAAKWLNQDTFKSFADRGDLELVHVPDLGAKHAFNEAIKGVSAIVHIASILSFSTSPQEVIPPVVESVTSILDAASRESSVKSFVYTSSIAAAVDITPGSRAQHAGRDAWNEKAVEIAWGPPPHPENHWHMVYQASKVEAEKAVWDFVKKQSPHYNVNVVSPATVLGEALHQKHLLSPYPWLKNLYYGNAEIGALFQAIVHIDVQDVAILHVAAALDPDCNGERLQAWGEHCNMNDILAILRRVYPDRKIMDDFINQTKLKVTADSEQPLGLLEKWGNQDGGTSLEKSVMNEMEGVLKWFPEN